MEESKADQSQPNSSAVAEFYDDFAKKQVRTGLNLRHYALFDEIKKSGLKRNHSILEIGCGIGTFTKLLLGYVKKGSVHGVDISPTNVEIANKELGAKNASFEVSDMTDFESDRKFDYVVMLDVLEHIPIEQHHDLFKTLRKHLKDDGTIFINIPHHDSLDYARIDRPEALQIIDQSLTTDLLIDNIYKNDFQIMSLVSHSIFFEEPDYQRIILKPRQQHKTMQPAGQLGIIYRKTILRAKAFLGNL